MTAVLTLATPLPADGSPDGEALLALERATQDRPLALGGLLHEATDDVRGVVLVARAGGADAGPIVGMASARLLGDDAHVIRLAVDAAHRRAGVGRALLDGLIGWAEDEGAPSLLLEVRAGDAAANAIYTAAGFAVEGRRSRYYSEGEDALLLRRAIDAAVTAAVDAAVDAGRG